MPSITCTPRILTLLLIALSALAPQNFGIGSFAMASGTTASPSTTTALDIFVSIYGNDSWSGSLALPNATQTDGPKRTIADAQALARQRLAEMTGGAQRRPINVRIESGEYRLTAPLTFTSADSGVPGAPVVYRAEVKGNVTLSGAALVGNAPGAVAGTTMTLPTPTLDASNMRGGNQLFVNGQRATLALAA